MIFGGDFYFEGFLRWNLGWPSPNYAGAFVATLLALAFACSGARWRWAALAVEAGGLFLLAKTYSRGAVLAWVAAWAFAVVAGRVWREPKGIVIWGARVAALGAMLWVVGFGWSRAGIADGTKVKVNERSEGGIITGGTPVPRLMGASASDGPMADKTTSEDGSVVNRLALWRGGLVMMADAPLRGWGAGESGRGYMNWYQEVNQEDGFATMVNSFLHVSVEHGLWAVGLVVMGLAGLLAMAWEGARGGMKIGANSTTNGRELTRMAEAAGAGLPAKEGERARDGEGLLTTDQPGPTRLVGPLTDGVEGLTRSSFCMAAGAAWVAWAMANVFSTLWIEPRLWIVPGIAAGLILYALGEAAARVWRGVISIAVVGGSVTMAGLWGAGLALAARQPWVAEPGRGGSVVVTARGAAQGTGVIWHTWTDGEVLGPTPGKELRRWLAAATEPVTLVVHPATAAISPAVGKNVLLVGGQAARLSALKAEMSDCVLVHPTALPPVAGPGEGEGVTVLLPELDEGGVGPAWLNWAQASGARVRVTPRSGQDIRAAWPEVMVAAMGAGHAAEKFSEGRR